MWLLVICLLITLFVKIMIDQKKQSGNSPPGNSTKNKYVIEEMCYRMNVIEIIQPLRSTRITNNR